MSVPGRRLEDLGAQLVQRAEELAVLHQLGLAPQARLDVVGERGVGFAALDDVRQQLGHRFTGDDVQTARAASSPRSGNNRSRNRRRARCRRTLAAASLIPSSLAMASWGRS